MTAPTFPAFIPTPDPPARVPGGSALGYGLDCFTYALQYGPYRLSPEAIDRALAASVEIVAARDTSAVARARYHETRLRLYAAQADHRSRLDVFLRQWATPEPTVQPDDEHSGGSKVPTHPAPTGPASPDALPVPHVISRPPVPDLPFRL